MYRFICSFFLVTFNLFAVQVHDPLHALEKVDNFIQAPSFEQAFKIGDYANKKYFDKVGSVQSENYGMKWEVVSVNSDTIEFDDFLMGGEITLKLYQDVKGSYLRDMMQNSFVDKEIFIEQIKPTKFKYKNKLLNALMVTARKTSAEVGKPDLLVDYTVIKGPYFAQLAVMKVQCLPLKPVEEASYFWLYDYSKQ